MRNYKSILLILLIQLFSSSCGTGKSKNNNHQDNLKNNVYTNCYERGGCGQFMVYGFIDSLNVLVVKGDSKNNDLKKYQSDFKNVFNDTTLIKEVRIDKYKHLEDIWSYCSDVIEFNKKRENLPTFYDMTSGKVLIKSNYDEFSTVSLIINGIFVSENKKDTIRIINLKIGDIEIGSSPG